MIARRRRRPRSTRRFVPTSRYLCQSDDLESAGRVSPAKRAKRGQRRPTCRNAAARPACPKRPQDDDRALFLSYIGRWQIDVADTRYDSSVEYRRAFPLGTIGRSAAARLAQDARRAGESTSAPASSSSPLPYATEIPPFESKRMSRSAPRFTTRSWKPARAGQGARSFIVAIGGQSSSAISTSSARSVPPQSSTANRFITFRISNSAASS